MSANFVEPGGQAPEPGDPDIGEKGRGMPLIGQGPHGLPSDRNVGGPGDDDADPGRPGERPGMDFVLLAAIAEFWLAAILAGSAAIVLAARRPPASPRLSDRRGSTRSRR